MRNLVWSNQLGHWTALPAPGLTGPRSPEAGMLYVDDDGTVRFVASATLSSSDLRDAKERRDTADARIELLTQRHIRAEIVAQYWLNEYLGFVRAGNSIYSVATHPLGLVISALDGVTDPDELGVSGEARTRLEAMT